MSKIKNFAYPTPIPAKIWGRSLWSRSVMLGSAESENVTLISREIIFAEFQPMWSRYLNITDGQTDGQTDGRTTCHGNTALRVASRGKNVSQTNKCSLLCHEHLDGMRETGFLEQLATTRLENWTISSYSTLRRSIPLLTRMAAGTTGVILPVSSVNNTSLDLFL